MNESAVEAVGRAIGKGIASGYSGDELVARLEAEVGDTGVKLLCEIGSEAANELQRQADAIRAVVNRLRAGQLPAGPIH